MRNNFSPKASEPSSQLTTPAKLQVVHELELEFSSEDLDKLDAEIAKSKLDPVIRFYLQRSINQALMGIADLEFNPENAMQYAYEIAKYRGIILVSQKLLDTFKSNNQ